MFPTYKITTAIALALGMGLTTGASAQMDTAPVTEPAQATPDTANGSSFDDVTIDAFAEAVIKVTDVQNSYAVQMEGVTNEGDQQSLVNEANAEIVATIEKTENLTVDQYMEIAEAAAADEQLNLKIAQRLQVLQTEQPG